VLVGDDLVAEQMDDARELRQFLLRDAHIGAGVRHQPFGHIRATASRAKKHVHLATLPDSNHRDDF